ncbi:MAG: CHAT domain-containing protein [Deltaproteobacteria bacterium]|nr:CHAT domain-containing protein [Deltaproteobacteria bacterium]
MLLFLWACPVHAKENTSAVETYGQARDAFGLAMGERGFERDPARKILLGQVAELMCLLGDAEGCLSASREAGRKLGLYTPVALHPEQVLKLKDAEIFLAELHRESADWGWDVSVATEGRAWLDQLSADAMREKLGKQHRAAYKRHLEQAKQGKGRASILASVQALDLAWRMLDQTAVAEAVLFLACKMEEPGLKIMGSDEKSLALALDKGWRVLRILGRKSDVKRVLSAIKRLNTTAKAPAEPDFPMAPAAESFKSDLGLARKNLAQAAAACPLSSRPAMVLGFLSSYAGVIAYEPDAAVQLRPLRESLALTDPYLGARVLALLGRDALLAGDYHRASKNLERAAKELDQHVDTRSLTGLMHANRAQALSVMGQHALAARAFAQAEKGLGRFPVAALQAKLGQAHSLTFAGKTAKAGKILAACTRFLNKLPKKEQGVLSRALKLDRALWLWQGNKRQEAEALYVQVAAEALAASDVKAGAIAQTNLAELANDAGKFGQALSHAESALKWLNRRSQADATWQALTEKGRALAGLGKRSQAEKALDEAMNLVESLRAQIGAEGARRSFAMAKTRLYAAAVGLAMDQGDAARAFYLAERARGRAFLDMLAERKISLGEPAWQASLGKARAHMLRALPPPSSSFAPPGLVRAANPKKAQAGRTLAPNPREGWRSLVSVNPARVRDVQSVLARDEALLAYFHDGKRLVTFVITAKEIKMTGRSLDASRLQGKVSSLMRSLADPNSKKRKVIKKAKALHKLCMDGVSLPKQVRRLLVVPWGPLHQVPFAALHDGKAWLLDSFDFAVVPSGSVLVMLRARVYKARSLEVLALANPATELPALPAAEKEADMLASLFGKSIHVLRGSQATESVFRREAPGKQFVHLASHGQFLGDRPMDSYLALAGPKGRKQELTAAEVLSVDLSAARLVVLSACHSGELAVQRGDERLGLSRAFLHSGARALVASLWELSDNSAVELTRELYVELKQGKTPTAALNQAQRKLKNNKRFTHPFYWAALNLVGS